MSLNLGTLSMDLNQRDLWPNEARDFTPWLADNLDMLGDALALDLEIVDLEYPVGPYAADILAREVAVDEAADDRLVVIENQLTGSNHDHLGKALTYAGNLKAKIIVWVAPKFTDEHLQAINWLNDINGEGFGFFAVKLELWKIDDSPPAVRFNVLARPLARKPQETQGINDDGLRQLRFWKAVSTVLAGSKGLKTRKPRPRHYLDVSLGRTAICLSNLIYKSGQMSVRLYLGGHDKEALYQALLRGKGDYERALVQGLEWIAPGGELKDKGLVVLSNSDLNWTDEGQFEDCVAWMAEYIVRFKEVFEPAVQAFRLQENG